MLLSSVTADIPVAELRGDDPEIAGIAFDSRRVEPGFLFVCIRGEAADGHRYAEDALRNGASALLVEEFLPVQVTQVWTPNSRVALARVAKTFYAKPDESLGLVSVTGTDGKTTTSSLIAWILRRGGIAADAVTTAGISTGGEMVSNPVHQTTPSALELQRLLADMRDSGTEWAVIETTSHGLDQHRVSGFAFNRAVFTRITHEHIDYHGSFAAYVDSKARLLQIQAEAPEESWGRAAVLPRDDDSFEKLRASVAGDLFTYGRSGDCDVRVMAEKSSVDGIEFRAASPWGEFSARSRLPGSFNIDNSLAAITCAASIGVDLATCVEGLATFPGVPGRMERIECGQPFAVIVDFAHTPESLNAVLSTLDSADGRLVAVFGAAGERDTEKRALMGAIAARMTDIFIITNEDPRREDPMEIAEQIASGARSGDRDAEFRIVLDRVQAIAEALDLARPGDTVLLAGKGHEASIIMPEETIPWDEAAVAREILSDMGFGG